MRTPPAPSGTAATVEQAEWIANEVQPHEQALRGYLRHQYPSVEVDDVVQESYLKLLKINAAGRITSAKAYFFSVARNTASKVLRRRQRLFSDIAVNELPDWRVLDGGDNAADTVNSGQQHELVAEAVDRLPSRCREIIRLAIEQELSTEEIAFRLGLSRSTVRVQMARGIKRCAYYLREQGEVE